MILAAHPKFWENLVLLEDNAFNSSQICKSNFFVKFNTDLSCPKYPLNSYSNSNNNVVIRILIFNRLLYTLRLRLSISCFFYASVRPPQINQSFIFILMYSVCKVTFQG